MTFGVIRFEAKAKVFGFSDCLLRLLIGGSIIDGLTGFGLGLFGFVLSYRLYSMWDLTPGIRVGSVLPFWIAWLVRANLSWVPGRFDWIFTEKNS